VRGGARTGAGRKKGSVTKATAIRQEMIAKAVAEGITPLDVMLGAMREAWEKGDKQAAANFAKDAAPYLHPRLASVEHKGDPDNPLETVTRIELTTPEGANGSHRTAPQVAPGIFRPS